MKKQNGKDKILKDNANYQSSVKVPLPQRKEYGTGLPYKAPKPKMGSKKKINVST